MRNPTTMLQIDPKVFCTRWRAWYPGTVPRGHLMRATHPGRWLRIHSLPEGKRYADSSAEQATLLARHNRAADLVLGEKATIALLGYDYAGRYHMPANHPLQQYLLPDAPPVMRLAPDDPEDVATSVFAALRVWRAGELDELFLGVADDRFRLLLLCWKTGAAVAPYDGGVDLFFASSNDRERMRPELAAWLSHRPDGL